MIKSIQQVNGHEVNNKKIQSKWEYPPFLVVLKSVFKNFKTSFWFYWNRSLEAYDINHDIKYSLLYYFFDWTAIEPNRGSHIPWIMFWVFYSNHSLFTFERTNTFRLHYRSSYFMLVEILFMWKSFYIIIFGRKYSS